MLTSVVLNRCGMKRADIVFQDAILFLFCCNRKKYQLLVRIIHTITMENKFKLNLLIRKNITTGVIYKRR